jgi:hypothetical protein
MSQGKFKLLPVPEVIREVEYYKKGGKVKKNKMKQKQKQKQSVVVNIDNSRRTASRKKSEPGAVERRQPMFLPSPSINISQPSQGSGISTLLLSKLLDKLGESSKVQEPQKLIESEPSLVDIVDDREDKQEKEDKEESSSSSSVPAGFLVPKIGNDVYDPQITVADAGAKVREYFSAYPELYTKTGQFRKGSAEKIARQYGIVISELGPKNLLKEIYKRIVPHPLVEEVEI